MASAKPTDKLTPNDWKKHPVWTFDLDNETKPGRDETWMVPLKKLPATDLRNCGCNGNAKLACGLPVTVVLWSVKLKSDLDEDELWKNFARLRSAAGRAPLSNALQYGIWVKDRWWLTEREGGFMSLGDYKKRDPNELAQALGLDIDKVFPINYDISSVAVGPDTIVRGKLLAP